MTPASHLRALIWSCALLMLTLSSCRSPYYADQGAALGGLAGAVTGAAVGDSHGNAAGGALIGSAVGALTGAAIGDSMDAEVARRQALIEARTGRRMAGAVTSGDVMTMVASGLSDDVIINHIRGSGVASSLTPGDIIEMHEAGVSEKVINAMQNAAARQAPPAVAYGAPVIIEESYVVPPPWHYRPYVRYHGPYRRHYRRPGMTWGFSYSN
jgi:hypothetical protein